jgi:pimeloyl-ACP methyl ester carboxylesterase
MASAVRLATGTHRWPIYQRATGLSQSIYAGMAQALARRQNAQLSGLALMFRRSSWDVRSLSKAPCRRQPRRPVSSSRWQPVRPGMETVLKQTFATPNGFEALIRRWFEEMFTGTSNAAVVASTVERAKRLTRSIGEKLLLNMLRYDVARPSLADLRVSVMAVQTTYNNEKRERRPMSKGQTTPYLDVLRARIPSVRIETIPDTGHFPQIDERTQTNALLDSFLATPPY